MPARLRILSETQRSASSEANGVVLEAVEERLGITGSGIELRCLPGVVFDPTDACGGDVFFTGAIRRVTRRRLGTREDYERGSADDPAVQAIGWASMLAGHPGDGFLPTEASTEAALHVDQLIAEGKGDEVDEYLHGLAQERLAATTPTTWKG